MSNPAIMPLPRQRYYDNNGVPLVNGMIYTYASGTSTPLPAFQDSAGVIPHANPIRLDAKGEATIYWLGSYKVDAKTEAGLSVTGYPVDNYTTPADVTSNSGSALVKGTWFGGVLAYVSDLGGNLGASLLGFLQAGAGAVLRSIQSKLRERVSVTDYMSEAQRADALTGTPTLDVTAAFEAARDANDVVYIPPGNYLVSTFSINKSNFSLIGAGYNKSILTTTAAANIAIEVASTANVTGLLMEDFKVQGNATGLGGIKLGSAGFYCAIPIFNRVNVWDFSLSSAGVAGFGIQLYKVQNATFNNCWVYRNRNGYQRPNAGYCTSTKIHGKSGYQGEGYIGVYIDGLTDDIYIDDSVIEGNTNSGVVVTANAVGSGRGSAVYINGSYFETNNAGGAGVIYMTGGAGAYQDHTLVLERCNFATNTAPYVTLDHVIATFRNCKLIPSQISTTANTSVHFDHCRYPNGSDYLAGIRAMLGNVTACDTNIPATGTDANQINYGNVFQFPSTPRLVSDPFAFDDYREIMTGWTPVASSFGGSISSITGGYVKLGRSVHFEIIVVGTALASTYGVSIISLPIATAKNTCCLYFNGSNGLGGSGYIDAASDKVLLPTIAAADAVLTISGTYIADE